jgi:hypothetical protein
VLSGHVHALCLFFQNQRFQDLTARLVSDMAASGRAANASLAAVGAGLEEQRGRLAGAAAQLGEMQVGGVGPGRGPGRTRAPRGSTTSAAVALSLACCLGHAIERAAPCRPGHCQRAHQATAPAARGAHARPNAQALQRDTLEQASRGAEGVAALAGRTQELSRAMEQSLQLSVGGRLLTWVKMRCRMHPCCLAHPTHDRQMRSCQPPMLVDPPPNVGVPPNRRMTSSGCSRRPSWGWTASPSARARRRARPRRSGRRCRRARRRWPSARGGTRRCRRATPGAAALRCLKARLLATQRGLCRELAPGRPRPRPAAGARRGGQARASTAAPPTRPTPAVLARLRLGWRRRPRTCCSARRTCAACWSSS